MKKNKVKSSKFTFAGTVFVFSSFIAVIATISIVVASKTKSNRLGHYSDYTSETIKLNEILTKRPNDVYYVYIYKSDCPGCKTLEKTILNYIKTGPKPLYLLDGDKYESDLIEVDYSSLTIKANYNVSDYKELRVASYPCLLLIQNGEVIAHNIGESTIRSQLAIR